MENALPAREILHLMEPNAHVQSEVQELELNANNLVQMTNLLIKADYVTLVQFMKLSQMENAPVKRITLETTQLVNANSHVHQINSNIKEDVLNAH
jgi:hypothetical protein